MKKIPIKYLSSLLLGYMVVAFCWWAIMLWKENNKLFESEKRYLELHFRVEQKGVNQTRLLQTQEYKDIAARHARQRRMILTEGLFFTGCLFLGLWFINYSVNREVALSKQRRNFMLSITHELKSPIAAIKLAFETICRRDWTKEQVQRLCGNGMKDANRLQALVEDLLLASRLEDNWVPLREPVDLKSTVTEICHGLLMRYPEARFELDVPDALPPVQADHSGLLAVLSNLLENALKYSPTASPVSLKARKLNQRTEITVADLGFGIPDTEKKAVFEKFYRLGNEETRRTTGTGLGLYIVKEVVKAHGGSLRVEDNRPKGTVFTIEI